MGHHLCKKFSGLDLPLWTALVFPPKTTPLSSPFLVVNKFSLCPLSARERKREREMQGTSKVIMGATLVMVISLAIVLGLILVLLAELYCSLLLRRRRFRPPPQNSTITASAPSPPPPTAAIFNPSVSPRLPPTNNSAVSLSSFYSHGVICAPRNFLFPAKEKEEPKKVHHYQLHHAIDIDETQNPSPPFPPSPSPLSGIFSQSRKTVIVQDVKPCCGVEKEILYISNPIFDGDSSRMKMEETPFETPNSSPSALQKSGSSSSSQSPVSDSPPLMPMKLPDEACSVSLGDVSDVRALQTWNSDSNSNNGLSSSSTGSPCTSPSW